MAASAIAVDAFPSAMIQTGDEADVRRADTACRVADLGSTPPTAAA